MRKPIRKPPAIPAPQPNIAAMFETIMALKESVEILQGQTGTKFERSVKWQELVNLGLVKDVDVPDEAKGTHGV